MQLPEIHIIDVHTLQRAMQLLCRFAYGASIGLSRHKELRAVAGQPGSDTSFSLSITGSHIDMVDPVCHQHLQRTVCLLLRDAAKRRGSKDGAGTQMARS